jgi:hypothetical protein
MLPILLLFGGQYPRDNGNKMSFPGTVRPHQKADNTMKWSSYFSLRGAEYFKMAATRLGSADAQVSLLLFPTKVSSLRQIRYFDAFPVTPGLVNIFNTIHDEVRKTR